MARNSAETRRRLVAAADELFYRQGIRAVGVDAVAEAAGVTKRTLYYHFASKDDLIAAYLADRDLPTLGRYQSLIPDPAEPAARQIHRIFEQLGKNAKDPRWKGCSFLRAAAEFANLPGHPARVVAARHKKRFEAWFRVILATDGSADDDCLARQLMILFDGAVAQILVHRDPSYAESAGAAASITGSSPPNRASNAAADAERDEQTISIIRAGFGAVAVVRRARSKRPPWRISVAGSAYPKVRSPPFPASQTDPPPTRA
jgi:AcrR family transcriptional regulator